MRRELVQAQPDVPAKLRSPVDAAVTWINTSQGQAFELTGLLDYERALTAGVDESYELGLVLCDGEICTREQVLVTPTEEGYEFSVGEASQREIPPLLDPPEGLRRSWLEGELANHEFVLLLFYRGLW